MEEIEQLIEEILSQIYNPFSDKAPVTYFKNPMMYYNPKNIVGIEFDMVTTGDFEKIIKKAQKTIGFKKS